MSLHYALLAVYAGVAGVMDAAARLAEGVRLSAQHRIPVDERRDACFPHEGVESEANRARVALFFLRAAGSSREVVTDCGTIGF